MAAGTRVRYSVTEVESVASQHPLHFPALPSHPLSSASTLQVAHIVKLCNTVHLVPEDDPQGDEHSGQFLL